ncbi:MAG: MerR family transcriptional regulator [Flavisolibacter sp.]|jgi:DNA-binding transcriptional MerR regulator|nr:MerR family transcriptional regulator [Flavisolibacter sp.]
MSFTIKELETLSGIKAHTIRIWEQRYHFLKPLRTQTNIRTYNNEELKTLLTVALLNKYGYKISRIDDMSVDQRQTAVLQLPQQEAYSENLVNVLIGHMIDINNVEFEEVLNQYIIDFGVEETITQIIFNFLERIGILWQTNKIIPVQEHIVSNIIRQKIVSAIEKLPFVRKTDPLFVLLLPEGEHHEMGLLFIYYLLRKHNIPVLYLGSNVPSKDVGYLFKIKKPSYLYLHLTTMPRNQSLQRYFAQLHSYSEEAKILVSGAVARAQKHTQLQNVVFFQSISETVDYIATLQSV